MRAWAYLLDTQEVTGSSPVRPSSFTLLMGVEAASRVVSAKVRVRSVAGLGGPGVLSVSSFCAATAACPFPLRPQCVPAQDAMNAQCEAFIAFGGRLPDLRPLRPDDAATRSCLHDYAMRKAIH